MIRLGLTGSIATGKSTVAGMFADAGIPVHDADAAVHAIYQDEGVEPIRVLVPQAIEKNTVDRQALKIAIAKDPTLLRAIEERIHPLVQAREQRRADEAQSHGHVLMVFDIPLLFETGADARMDKVAVVHCDPDTQMSRLMARDGMTEATAQMLIARQMPQAEKMRRADVLISTDQSLEEARAQVAHLIAELRA